MVAMIPWIKLYLAGAVYPPIGACSPRSNLCSMRQLFGDEESNNG
jgi:hypothetical protein